MTGAPSRESNSFDNRKLALALALTTAVALTLFVRLKALSIPLERDEGEYAYGGQLLLEGVAPYQLCYSVKLPGTCAAYAAIMAIFGQTPSAIHLGFLLVNMASLALLVLIARRLVGNAGAVVAGTMFALLSMSPGVLGLQGHATHLVTFFALAGTWAWFRARESQRLVWIFSSGTLFGLSFLCKQPGLFFGLFGGVVILHDAWRVRPVRWNVLGANLGLFLTGLALPYAITSWYIWRAGTFGLFWFWTVKYASMHAGLLTPATVLAQFLSFFKEIGWVNLALPIAGAGLVRLLLQKSGDESSLIMLVLLGCSWLAFCAGLYFSRHYFIVMLPVVSLLAAVAWDALAKVSEQWRWVAPASFAVCCGIFVFLSASIWFQLTPDAVSRSLYGNNPFVEAPAIGRFIKDKTAPDARVAVFGSEPEILLYAHRKSATGFIYMYDLVWRQKLAHEMQLQMIHEIDEARPEYIVMVNVMPSWMFWRDSDTTIVDWGNDLVRRQYDDAGAAYIYPDHSEYAWTAADMKKSPDTPDLVLIYHRRAQP
jgi:hypothetical protein